ncbi:MAG TPA: SpoIIE family protein phosphatase [Bryobacteraceae bacterium]|nr:SpoIIE family protein phosphatase [Bryobacteraceae bacterium]
MPTVSGLDYHGEYRPASPALAKEGGDFFDFVPLAGSTLALSLGELSGAGAGTSVLMSGLQASLRGFAENGPHRISTTVEALNRTLCDLSPDYLYARLFYARLDASAHELTYVGAGHEPVLLVRRRPARIRRLESTGAVMGLTRRSAYHQRSLPVEPGDLLIAFSDGLSDALSPAGRAFTEAGVLEAVLQTPDAGATELAREIMTAVDRFTGHEAPADDRTVVVVRVRGPRPETVFERHAAEPVFAAA